MDRQPQRIYFRFYRSTFERDVDQAAQAIGYRLAFWLRIWCMRPGLWNRGQVTFIAFAGFLVGLALGRVLFAPF